jgi:general secretion pathway protein J
MTERQNLKIKKSCGVLLLPFRLGSGQAFVLCLLPFNLKDRKGFTLLELLIAMAIVSVITAIIANSLQIGIVSWERGEAATERYQRLRVLLDEMTQQLKSVYPYKVQKGSNTKPKLVFLGEEHSLGFATTLVKGSQGELGGGLVFVYYELDDEKGLIKKEKVVFSGDISVKDLGDPIELDSEISRLTFEYYEKSKTDPKSGRWLNAWEGKSKDKLPAAIRITLAFRRKDKTNSTDQPSEETTLTVPTITEPKSNPFSANPTIPRPNISGPNPNPLLINPPNQPVEPDQQ